MDFFDPNLYNTNEKSKPNTAEQNKLIVIICVVMVLLILIPILYFDL
jgi:hypothetical protein